MAPPPPPPRASASSAGLEVPAPGTKSLDSSRELHLWRFLDDVLEGRGDHEGGGGGGGESSAAAAGQPRQQEEAGVVDDDGALSSGAAAVAASLLTTSGGAAAPGGGGAGAGAGAASSSLSSSSLRASLVSSTGSAGSVQTLDGRTIAPGASASAAAAAATAEAKAASAAAVAAAAAPGGAPAVSRELERAILEPLRYQSQVHRASRSNAYIDTLVEAFNGTWLKASDEACRLVRRVCIELYAATCMLGDMSAGATEQRGSPSPHRIYGVPLTLNTANLGFFLAMQGCVELDELREITPRPAPAAGTAAPPRADSAIQIFTEELIRMHRGQGHDLEWRAAGECPTESDYLAMLADKTGAILRLAVRLLQAHSTNDIWARADLMPITNALALFLAVTDDYKAFSAPKPESAATETAGGGTAAAGQGDSSTTSAAETATVAATAAAAAASAAVSATTRDAPPGVSAASSTAAAKIAAVQQSQRVASSGSPSSSSSSSSNSSPHSIIEGRFTLPVIHCIKHARPGDMRLRRILGLRPEDTDAELVAYAIRFMGECGSLDYTRDAATALAEKVHRRAAELGGNAALDSLLHQVARNRMGVDLDCSD